MQVEVNEHTIVKYGLVQLTGNSVEVLLARAAEAAEQGYVLAVTVPDDETITHNVFDSGFSRPVSAEELADQDRFANPIMSDYFDIRRPAAPGVEVVEVRIVPTEDEGDIVDGEIVDDD